MAKSSRSGGANETHLQVGMRRGRKKDLELRAVAARLRSLRLKRVLTQWAMAERGLSYKYYQRIEAGRANVTIRTLARVAQALGVPFDELFRFGPHHSGPKCQRTAGRR